MTRSHLHLRAKPGQRDALLRELERLEVFATAREQPGLHLLAVLVPEDDADSVLVEGSWSSSEYFSRWWESRSRDDLVGHLGQHLVEEPTVVVYQVVDTIS